MTPDEGAAAMKEHDVKHYEFVPDDTIKIAPAGKVLHRIRATTHIEAHGVKPGDLGGYIESPEKLGERVQRDEALLRQALEALEWMVRTTGDTLEIPGVTHPSLTAARAAIAALRERLGDKP